MGKVINGKEVSSYTNIEKELRKMYKFIENNYIDEHKGSVIEFCYKAEILKDNGKDGYSIFNDSIINELDTIYTNELIEYFEGIFFFLFSFQDLILVLAITNYLLRRNKNLKIFTFVYSYLIEKGFYDNEKIQELFLHKIDIEALREEYPEYPMLSLI